MLSLQPQDDSLLELPHFFEKFLHFGIGNHPCRVIVRLVPLTAQASK